MSIDKWNAKILHLNMVTELIGKKQVFTVQDHEHVIEAWAKLRSELKRPPILITLDHHLDTSPPFSVAVCSSTEDFGERISVNYYIKWVAEQCKRFDYNDPKSVAKIISMLKWDEHIHAAILLKLIDHAYVISFDGRKEVVDSGGEKYCNKASDDIFVLASDFVSPSPYGAKGLHPDPEACEKVIESANLLPQMAEINILLNRFDKAEALQTDYGVTDVFKTPYILDIDLDYFSCRKSLTPTEPQAFHRLIRDAVGITIATEPQCVAELQIEPLPVDWMLAKLKDHILAAQQ